MKKSTQTYDPFRPRREPQLTLYKTLLEEAKNRSYKDPEEWIECERKAVWRAARDYAQQHGLRVPTIEEVEKGENYASGHVDYASKFTLYVTELLYGDNPIPL